MKALWIYLAMLGVLLGTALFLRSLPHVQAMLITGALMTSCAGIAFFVIRR